MNKEPKIGGYIMTKNGLSGFLKTAVNSLYSTCDVVYTIDGGSDDGTYEWMQDNPKIEYVLKDSRDYNKYAHEVREKCINALLSEDIDFILALDCDESIVAPTNLRQMIKKTKKDYNTIGFSFYHLWRGTKYRTGGTWEPCKIPRLIGTWVDDVTEIKIYGDGSHTPRVPTEHVPQRKIAIGPSIIHYGWKYKDPEKRRQKMKRKEERDKAKMGKESSQWKEIQKKHYASIYEEPELRELPWKWRSRVVPGYKDEQKNAI